MPGCGDVNVQDIDEWLIADDQEFNSDNQTVQSVLHYFNNIPPLEEIKEPEEKISFDTVYSTLQTSLSFLEIGQLQTTRETAANMFRGYLARKNYTARELPTHFAVCTISSLNIFWRKNLSDFVILPLVARNSSKRET